MTEMKTIALTIVICLLLSVTAQEPVRSNELSMMDTAIDDRFHQCIKKTAKKVIEVYFPREIQISPFREAWNKALPCALKNLRNLQTKFKDLNINHTRAICVYTEDKPNLYDPLNSAVRSGANIYSTPAFQYHALYFWLTSAIQILRQPCQTTYRRSKEYFNGKKGDIIRFGYFASSSKRPDLTWFGKTTCFYIKTCLGAYVEKYTQIPGEEEVLIPSYEKFKIIDIVYGSYKELKCDKIFVLDSKQAPLHTRLNCKAANHTQRIRANIPLILVFLAFGWFVIESISNDKMRN